MRLVSFLVLAALACGPASGQSALQPDDARQGRGPNAEVAQRPLGPNAQVMERPATGPNTELMRNDRFVSETYYPSCAAAGAVRSLPIRRGEPGYSRQLDRNDDGVACEISARPLHVEGDR